jgi:hypothetical protein
MEKYYFPRWRSYSWPTIAYPEMLVSSVSHSEANPAARLARRLEWNGVLVVFAFHLELQGYMGEGTGDGNGVPGVGLISIGARRVDLLASEASATVTKQTKHAANSNAKLTHVKLGPPLHVDKNLQRPITYISPAPNARHCGSPKCMSPKCSQSVLWRAASL